MVTINPRGASRRYGAKYFSGPPGEKSRRQER